ncbi:hypothetical protein A3844_04405 [Paenibacillus helianthi]|uniref:Sporulation protein n=1 Tax=Paenibacillus helianthi TaxID=1349432 RepID=A0ABX3ET18_9BACL|nr:hypothetical protein [Paenibacillus helianthi]OKP91084.1 hypothetical protein A3844_04405 [Paenibacillus helianthi]
MKKLFFVTLISLLFLIACSSQQKYSSANEAIKSLEKNITQIKSPGDKNLDGIQPVSYKLNNEEIIRVYDFGSEEKREIGKKFFEESIQLLSSHAPIVYQSGKYLVLYYSHVDSKTRTPKLNETKYGEKIEKALKSI